MTLQHSLLLFRPVSSEHFDCSEVIFIDDHGSWSNLCEPYMRKIDSHEICE